MPKYILFFILFSLVQPKAYSKPLDICSFFYSPDFLVLKEIHKVKTPKIRLSEDKFNFHFENIQETLSGNLSTVRRIENKWKTQSGPASDYLIKLTSSADDLKKLTPKKRFESMVQKIKTNKFKNINMRDKPPASGATDHTFTYYTKPIVSETGAKHQYRFRTYVREINPDKLTSKTVMGFMEDGSIVGVEKVAGKYVIKKFKKVDGELIVTSTQSNLNLQEFKSFYKGMDTPKMYAYPHGKGLKMEVKSRLSDNLESNFIPNMNGQSFVQKLDIPVTMDDVKIMFDSKNLDPSLYDEALLSLRKKLSETSQKKYGDIGPKRVDAFFKLYDDALRAEPNMRSLSGATEYQRVAFELPIPDKIDGSSIKIQTTFDYDQATRFVYNRKGKLESPIEVFENQTRLTPENPGDLHVEFKAPEKLVQKVVEDPSSVSDEFRNYIKLFNDSKPNADSHGKFNFIMGNY
jgi:hypothetical protein